MSERWDRIRPHLVPLLGLRPWRRHSLVLAVGGGVYFLIGLAYLLTPMTTTRSQSLRVPLALTDGNIEVWAVMWMLFGALAFASTRWPPASETWGYTAMSSISALWACFAFAGTWFGAPITSTIVGVLVWSLFGFLWWAVSGLRNPEEMLPLEVLTIEGE